ncbi:MAG: hypothetical protein KDC98_11505 [Planctomycetes bacterium]|nr:hypothetical protein [Planctomycetota bacterium]
MTRSLAVPLLFSLTLAGAARGQFGGSGADGALQPTGNIVLDTSGRPAGWSFTTIDIPWGVVVRLQGSNPAILRCTGSVSIQGGLIADGFAASGASPGAGGPGGYPGGQPGQVGGGPAGGRAGSMAGGWWFPAGPGGHSSYYGNARPFDLRGGSGGGGATYNGPLYGQYGGHGGGGVVVLLADGDITVQFSGAVTANGGGGSGSDNAPGAGGGVLIRSASSVAVLGTVSAAGGPPPSSYFLRGDDGFVRMDAWGDLPDIRGALSIAPPATLLALPSLASTTPMLGSTWVHAVASLPNDTVFVAFSLGTATINLGNLGVLGIDPYGGIVTLGSAVVPPIFPFGADLDAAIYVAVPASPIYAGLALHTQAIALLTTSPSGPRLSNVVHGVVQ